MSSQLEIWNNALAHVGVKQFVQSVDEKSMEAAVLRVRWDSSVKYVLADHPWPFATAYATLNLVEEQPNTDWLFSYRYPADCIHARRIVSPLGRTDPEPPPFKTGQDDQGRLIYTDAPDAVLEYTKDVTQVARFDQKFVEALEWYLASRIATPLSRIDGAASKATQMYEFSLVRAASKTLKEAQQDNAPDAEWVRERE